MKKLREISQPNIAVFTNIGPSHLEFFDTPENILKAKIELTEGFAQNNTVIINADDQLLKEEFSVRKMDFNTVTFGISEASDFRARIKDINNKGVNFEVAGVDFYLPVLGVQNIYNALAAIAVGSLFNITGETISLSLKDFCLPSMRMNTEELSGFTLIDDTYNSNPASLKFAIETLAP